MQSSEISNNSNFRDLLLKLIVTYNQLALRIQHIKLSSKMFNALAFTTKDLTEPLKIKCRDPLIRRIIK